MGRIHATPMLVVYEFAGAGSLALRWLHAVPGSSRTVLEATDRYSPASLASLLGRVPEQAVSEGTASAMAAAAYQRARELAPPGQPVAGLACTAAIATDRARRGADRALIATYTPECTTVSRVDLAPGPRSEQEEAVSRAVIAALADVCGVA